MDMIKKYREYYIVVFPIPASATTPVPSDCLKGFPVNSSPSRTPAVDLPRQKDQQRLIPTVELGHQQNEHQQQ